VGWPNLRITRSLIHSARRANLRFLLVVFAAIWDRIFAAPFLGRGASLEFKGELKRCPMLSMVGDEKCLVLFHGLGQLLKVGLSELSRQEVCPAIRMHRILHHWPKPNIDDAKRKVKAWIP
jgi:hypothetical protein